MCRAETAQGGEFFRVNAIPAYTCDTAVIEVEGEWFLVAPQLRGALQADIKNVQIYTCMTRAGALFLWPVRLPGADGRDNGGGSPPTRSPAVRRPSGSGQSPTWPLATTM